MEIKKIPNPTTMQYVPSVSPKKKRTWLKTALEASGAMKNNIALEMLNNSNGTGYFIYPGLYGNVIIYRVVENNISAKVGSVSSSVKDSSGFTPDEIRKVIMESLMKFTDLDDFDIKHLMMDRLELQRLFEDIRDWTWNTRKY